LFYSPSNKKPTWDIVLYAYNLLILDWDSPKIDPITKDARELTINIDFQEKWKGVLLEKCTNWTNKTKIPIFGIIDTKVVTIVGMAS
jgi:hypothetical protein